MGHRRSCQPETGYVEHQTVRGQVPHVHLVGCYGHWSVCARSAAEAVTYQRAVGLSVVVRVCDRGAWCSLPSCRVFVQAASTMAGLVGGWLVLDAERARSSFANTM